MSDIIFNLGTAGWRAWVQSKILELKQSAGVSIVNNLTETITGKALDATMGKVLQDSKYPKLGNGNGMFMNIGNTIADLAGMGFSLSGAYLYNAYLNYALLQNIDLSYTNMDSVSAQSADFSGANLSYANLGGGQFMYTTFLNANLSYTNLTWTGLINTNLSYANFTGANLENTMVVGTNFSNAIGLNSDINIALMTVFKDPNIDGQPWTLTWTNGNTYSCDPSTGLFTLL